MQPISAHHDQYFKANMGQADIAAGFLKNYLPPRLAEQIDLTSLQLENSSFIEPELKQLYSDLLYRAKIGTQEAYVYFLFEHKSSNDKNIALQLLGYLLSIYRANRKKEPNKPLSPVLPIVFYHGKSPWKVGRHFSDLLISNEELLPYIPDFTYFLYDTNTYEKEEMQGEIPLQVFLRIMKGILSEGKQDFYETLWEIIQLLEHLQDEQRERAIFEMVIRYIFSAREDADFDEISKQMQVISRERSEELMSIAEKLEQRGLEKGMRLGKEQGMQLGIIEGKKQGIEEGMQQGIEQGERKKMLEVAKNMLDMNSEVEFIMRATGLSREEIEKL